jgi:hypothetical protein
MQRLKSIRQAQCASTDSALYSQVQAAHARKESLLQNQEFKRNKKALGRERLLFLSTNADQSFAVGTARKP